MRKSTRIAAPPDGFRYEEELISPSEQADLVAQFEGLPLKEFEFHGYTGKRRVISFGWHYDFGAFSLNRTDEMPEFLFPLRERAAGFADLKPEDFPHVLITEYSPARRSAGIATRSFSRTWSASRCSRRVPSVSVGKPLRGGSATR